MRKQKHKDNKIFDKESTGLVDLEMNPSLLSQILFGIESISTPHEDLNAQ